MNKETVSLKPLKRKDLDAFWEWASDNEVTNKLMWDSYTSKAAAEKFLIDVAEKHPWFQAIHYNGTVVGSITLEKGEGTHSNKAELGYVIAQKYWGKGIGTAAVREALKKGFQDLGIQKIEVFVDPENISSQRVLEKNDFIQEKLIKNHVKQNGVLRDRYLYSFST